MPELEQAGVFRGRIIEYGLYEADSKAVAVTLKMEIDEIYHEGEWHDWREHEFDASGSVWVVKKDGKLNKSQCDALIKYAGWDGSFTSILARTWDPIPCCVIVNPDEYKGVVRYKIAWVNAYDSTPGGSNMDEDRVKKLQDKLGGELRAIAGNKVRNEAPKAVKGPPAKPPKAKAAPAATPEPTVSQEPPDDIPFSPNVI